MLGMLQPIDIVLRLCFRKPYWLHGTPSISLEGEEKEFGKLIFDFKDEIVGYRIYIKDKQKILETARFAIDNFGSIAVMVREQY